MASTTTCRRARAEERVEEEMTDEQIDYLLKLAEERLQNPAQRTLTTLQQDVALLPKSRKGDLEGLPTPYVDTTGDVARADHRRLVESSSRTLANGIRRVEDPLVAKRQKLEDKKATAGPSWYNLPKTNLTPELKRDLQLLRMRSVLDPKRFYKKENTKAKPPAFSQIGTIIEGPTDFFSGRIAKRDRKKTLADEIMAGERESGKFKKLYTEIQAKKTSGKKGDYKKRMELRYGKKLTRG